jgi:uncharacterized oligopeptide transporter (OPT) family protein
MENWNFFLEWTPAFIGVGMLSGMNTSFSMFGGSFLAWGILGPLMVKTGEAVGRFKGGNATQLDEWAYFGMYTQCLVFRNRTLPLGYYT